MAESAMNASLTYTTILLLLRTSTMIMTILTTPYWTVHTCWCQVSLSVPEEPPCTSSLVLALLLLLLLLLLLDGGMYGVLWGHPSASRGRRANYAMSIAAMNGHESMTPSGSSSCSIQEKYSVYGVAKSAIPPD